MEYWNDGRMGCLPATGLSNGILEEWNSGKEIGE